MSAVDYDTLSEADQLDLAMPERRPDSLNAEAEDVLSYQMPLRLGGVLPIPEPLPGPRNDLDVGQPEGKCRLP